MDEKKLEEMYEAIKEADGVALITTQELDDENVSIHVITEEITPVELGEAINFLFTQFPEVLKFTTLRDEDSLSVPPIDRMN